MDRYNFMSLVDDIFKECHSTEELCDRYVQLKKDLDGLFQQNLMVIPFVEEGAKDEVE